MPLGVEARDASLSEALDSSSTVWYEYLRFWPGEEHVAGVAEW